MREHFFGPDPRLRRLVAHLSDDAGLGPAAGRPRLPEDVRRLPGGRRVAGRPGGDPGQDGEGLDPGPRRRGAQRHPPDQEAEQRPVAGAARPAAAAGRDPRRGPGRRPGAPLLPSAARLPRGAVPAGPAARPGRAPAEPPGGAAPPPPPPRPRALCRVRRRFGSAGGLHHHGLHPPAAQPGPAGGLRAAGGAHHPRRGPHLRHGRPVQGAAHLRLRGAALRAGGPSPAALLQGGARRADPGGGDHRGRGDVLVDRRRHLPRHPRGAHGPLLHLLLDVRLPAGGRPDLAGR